MAVPLFNTSAPLAAIDAEIRAKVSAILDAGVYVLGPEVRAFEAEFAAYTGTDARDRRGQRHRRAACSRCARWASARATRSSSRRSRSTRRPRRSRTRARAPSSATSTRTTMCITPETVRAVLTPSTKAVIAVHLFGNVAPVEEIEALGVPVIEDAAQAAGTRPRRRPPPRRARHDRDLPSTRPRTSARSATAARSPPTTTRSPRRSARCASTARATSRRSSWSATTPASTSSRRASCASSSRTSTAGPTAAAPPAAHYEEAGLGELVSLPVADRRAPQPAWHLYVVRSERADELRDGAQRRRHRRRAPTTASRRTCSRRCASGAQGRRAPGHGGGGAHEPRAPDEPGAEPERDESSAPTRTVADRRALVGDVRDRGAMAALDAVSHRGGRRRPDRRGSPTDVAERSAHDRRAVRCVPSRTSAPSATARGHDRRRRRSPRRSRRLPLPGSGQAHARARRPQLAPRTTLQARILRVAAAICDALGRRHRTVPLSRADGAHPGAQRQARRPPRPVAAPDAGSHDRRALRRPYATVGGVRRRSDARLLVDAPSARAASAARRALLPRRRTHLQPAMRDYATDGRAARHRRRPPAPTSRSPMSPVLTRGAGRRGRRAVGALAPALQ